MVASRLPATLRLAVVLLGAAATSACGDAESNAPETTKNPTFQIARGDSGFGELLAAGGNVGTATVWGGFSTGSDTERLTRRCTGRLDTAKSEMTCDDYCSGGDCPSPTADFVHLVDPASASDHCFALGIGDGAVRLDCEGEPRAWPLPDSLDDSKTANWRIAADPGVSPLLAVADPDAGRAWYYSGEFDGPIELNLAGEVPEGFGAGVAVTRLGPDRFNSRFVAVSAPDAGEVWLFGAGFPSIDAPFRIGCLGSRPGFGRRMASGDVDGDSVIDLIIADDEFVTVFSGAAVGVVLVVQERPACSLGALPPKAIIASVSCGSGGLTSGCSDAKFGASLAVADLDGDADGELLIGAPEMRVLDKQSGAVLVYDAEGKKPYELTETLVDTTLSDGARFGATLGVVQGKNVDAAVVGAPGDGAIFLAPCFSITRPELRPKICGGS